MRIIGRPKRLAPPHLSWMKSGDSRLKVLDVTGVLIVVISAVILTNVEEYSFGQPPTTSTSRDLPSVQAMIESRTDVWGDAAMRQPNGATYEFFKDLMPPLRWVNAEFRHYPIVLSAPRAAHKVRFVSNGSAINARANEPPMWFEQGMPIRFFVGDKAELFGEDLPRLEGPKYLDGYLPVVRLNYRAGDAQYEEEVFAPVDDFSRAHGVALVRFSLGKDSRSSGRVVARIEGGSQLREQKGRVLERPAPKKSSGRPAREASPAKQQVLFDFSPNWNWDSEHKSMSVALGPMQSAVVRVLTKPAVVGAKEVEQAYEAQRRECIDNWQQILSRSTKIVTPEPLVNDAWRSLLIGNFMLAVGDLPHYSFGNAYGPGPGSPRHLYEGECGDTTRSFLLFGHSEVGPGMLKSMLNFNREDTQFHVAGQKLQLLSFFYWLTHDAKTIRALEPLWHQSVDLILKNRETESGLLPPDRYAGDIPTKVYSLNSNANCWKGLHNLAAVLEDMGSNNEASKLRVDAAVYRKAILRAVDRSIRHDTEPPYIPISLLANEQPPDPLTSTELGSYYDLICPYIINSEIFGPGSEQEDWLIGYLQNHGGICMGMMRTERHQGINKGSKGKVPLYALRYNLTLLRRDEREKALVAFYGQLAQGMTRGTFIGGEGDRFLFHGDANGREFVLPPNSTSNATWLAMLRYLLIQDWDLDEDGVPDTLRLMYGVPRAWLADGQKIYVEEAPTMFGAVSFNCDSQLKRGYVDVHVKPPERRAKTMMVRAPLPDGWACESAEIDGEKTSLGKNGSVDLTGRTRALVVRYKVKGGAATR